MLVDDLRELAIGCGLRVTSIRSERVQTNYGPATAHRFTFSPESASALPLWHEAKRANLRARPDRHEIGLELAAIGYLRLPPGMFAQRVLRVHEEPAEEVFDISVDHESHAFVCDGILVHNCWLEDHGGRQMWVVRKGATPAFPGQRGFVGGSMRDDAVILEGVDPVDNPNAAAENQAAALFSTVHGAGRVMSRNAARGRRRKVHGRWMADPSRPGAISRQDMERWITGRGVVLRGADTDEAPQAYKRLPEVLRHHAGTVRILHTLSPIGVAMAAANEFDPYKD
jgi:RNA-splicing ligase RtcB